MSVVFLIRSEEHVRSGAPWCGVFAESIDTSIVPVILGSESKILEKHTETFLDDRFKHLNHGPTDALTVESDLEAVLGLARQEKCELLVIMYSEDQHQWQKSLFEKSTFPTVWLCPASDPPTDESHLIGGLQTAESLSNQLSMKLLGMRPSHYAIDSLPAEEVDQEDRIESLKDRLEMKSNSDDSLILIPIESVSKSDMMYAVGRRLLDHDFGTSVVLVREGQSIVPNAIDRFRRWTDSITPPMDRGERILLQEDLESGSKPSWEFLGLISAASMLAAFGLLQNSAAVIIGAMLIAPLMTPILGAGQAIAMGNRPLFRTASTAIALGFVGAFVSSALFGGLVRLIDPMDLNSSNATEIWARCNPTPIDFCVGLVGGMAAAYARTRSHLSSALAGAAIAAALVPPISTAGLQLAFGIFPPHQEGTPILGPLLVVSINVLMIMVGSSFVLWLRGIRARSHEERKRDRWGARVLLVIIAIALLVLVGLQARWISTVTGLD